MAAARSGSGPRDLTQGPIAFTLLAFALPTLGSNILQSLNASVNTIWVGRFLGEAAIVATSTAGIVMFLTLAAVFGFGMAALVLVGQAMGRHDIDAARRAFGAATGLVVGGSILFAVPAWLFAPAILRLMSTPPDVMALALDYLRWILLGLPASMLLAILMMGLRGVGDAMTPLWFMVANVVLDAGLNPILIAGIGPLPALGIAGSAIATLVAANLVALGMVAVIYWRDLPIRLKGAELAYLIPRGPLTRTIMVKGVPMGAQMLVMSFAALTMIGLVNRMGVDTAAAYGISQQLWTYIQMPAMAIGAAVSAMAAQNIGAGRWDRVHGITRAGVIANIALTGIMVGAVIAFDRPMMALFVGADSPAIPIARHIQLISSWNFVLFGVTMVLFATVRANGAVWGPLIALVIALYPVRIGFALAFLPALGADALWWSFPLGSAVALAMAAAYYRWGGWRQIKLLPPAREAGTQALATTEPVGRQQPGA